MTADLGFKIVYELFCVPDAKILTCLMVLASAYKIYIMAMYMRCVCITCYVSHDVSIVHRVVAGKSVSMPYFCTGGSPLQQGVSV